MISCDTLSGLILFFITGLDFIVFSSKLERVGDLDGTFPFFSESEVIRSTPITQILIRSNSQYTHELQTLIYK